MRYIGGKSKLLQNISDLIDRQTIGVKKNYRHILRKWCSGIVPEGKKL